MPSVTFQEKEWQKFCSNSFMSLTGCHFSSDI